MKFTVDKKIFEKFPGVTVGILVIEGLNNVGHSEKILDLLRAQEKKIASTLSGVDLSILPEVTGWREIYKGFGSNPKEFRSSIEALLRRAQAGKQLPQINNLVDMYNYLSLNYRIPAGAEDLDKVKGHISLNFADGSEKGIYLGSDKVEACYPGEVIYKDDYGFICRRWNWREADRTKIDEDTRNAILVFEKAPGIADMALSDALKEAQNQLSSSLGGTFQSFIVSADRPEVEVPFVTGSKAKPFIAISKQEPVKEKIGQKEIFQVSKRKLYPEGSLEKTIMDVLEKILEDLGVTDVEPEVEISGDPRHGEYTTNIAMRLAKVLKKPPMDIALQVKESLEKKILSVTHKSPTQNTKQTDQKRSPHFPANVVLQDIKDIQVVPPGFINVFLTEAKLSSQLGEVLKQKNAFGTGQTMKDKKIVIEYTDPNPFKEFHIGHLISNVTGESLARLKEAIGAKVWRADYFGDVGTHVAKSIWGLQKKMKEDHLTLKDLAKKSLAERVSYMGGGYALGTHAFEEEHVKEEMARLNTVLYIVAQKMWAAEGKKSAINYDPEHKISPKDIESVYDLYVTGRKWSLEYFETIYKRLGTKFDGYYPESIVGEVGYQFVIDNIGKAFEKSEGAIVFRGEKYGLHTRVFINKHNLPTYEAKELGLAPTKYKDFPYNESIIVVGKEIKEYFAVLVAALKEINPKLGNVTKPIFTGMVNLPGGKMSSRFGNVVTVLGLIDKLKDMVTAKIADFDYTKEQKEEISEKVAIAALKYSMLRVSLPSDIAFDFEKSLSFDGDSGPYLLYTYARCKSVLRKAGRIPDQVGNDKMNPEEKQVARLIAFFPEIVADAAMEFAPNVLCKYLFDLSQAFNLFYQKHAILGNDFRLALTDATAQVLHNGLYLLGIETVERM